MGYDVFVGWAEEGSWAEDPIPARTEFGRPYDDSRLQHEKPQQPYEWLAHRDPSSPFYQAERGIGAVVIPAVYDGMGTLLKHCMGALATAANGAQFDHVYTLDDKPFTRAASPLTGLAVELHMDLPDSGFEASLGRGVRVRSFGSNFRANEETRWITDLVAQRVDLGPKTGAPSFPDYGHATQDPTIKPTQILFKIDGGTKAIYGVEWNVNNNLRDDKVELGSRYIAAPRAQGKREVTGTIEKEWLAKTDYDKFVAGTPAALEAEATGPDLGNGPLKFKVEWPNVRYTGETPALQEGEEQDHSLPFTAYRDDGTIGAMRITVTNDSASGG